MSERPSILVVAATDSTGGAGLRTDWRACDASGVHGRAAVTAVTAQRNGEAEVSPVAVKTLEAQLDAAGTIQAVKVGLVPDSRLVAALAAWLDDRALPVVLDPVAASSGGAELTTSEAFLALAEEILPRCTVVTPNLPECERLLGRPIEGEEAARTAAEELASRGCAVLLKGGHRGGGQSVDLLVTDRGTTDFVNDRRQGRPLRGTGCWLSTTLAARLAIGMPLERATAEAIASLQEAWPEAHPLGDGTAVL